MRAWIEIEFSGFLQCSAVVALFMRAWIEMIMLVILGILIMSPSS